MHNHAYGNEKLSYLYFLQKKEKRKFQVGTRKSVYMLYTQASKVDRTKIETNKYVYIR